MTTATNVLRFRLRHRKKIKFEIVPFPEERQKKQGMSLIRQMPTVATHFILGGEVFVECMSRLILMNCNQNPSLNAWLEMVRC